VIGKFQPKLPAKVRRDYVAVNGVVRKIKISDMLDLVKADPDELP